MSQVFISYHRAQRKLARLLAHRIAADGHAVWWDRGERPGDTWSEAVSTALANSACVVVVWSRQAVTSPWVLGEATAGYGRGALVSVMADKTKPPSPFDSAPLVDMQDWAGDSIDLAWIRLRDPIRAKLQTAEKVADVQAPLAPPRAPPVRVGFSSAAMSPPPPMYEEKRGGSAFSTLMILALGGLAASGWYYRDQVRDELARVQAAWPPAPVEQAALPAAPPPPIAAASMTPPPLSGEAPPPAETPPMAAMVADAKAPPAKTDPDSDARYAEAWRDTFVPAPVLRSLPREPAANIPASLETTPNVASAPVAAAPSGRLEHVALSQGRYFDLDGAGARRHETDVWFALDRSGYGPYLGVAHDARSRASSVARATPAHCATGLLRRTPIPARDLVREGGLCLKSSEGVVSAWRVEGIDKGPGGSVLRLRAVPP